MGSHPYAVRSSAFAAVAVLALAVVVTACTAGVDRGTAAEARTAFQQLYAGYSVASVEPSGATWLVRATVTPDQTELYGAGVDVSPAPRADVLIPIAMNGDGGHLTQVNGATWSSRADLADLMRTNRDSEAISPRPLFEELMFELEATGTVISDVSATTDTVGVSFTGPGGQRWGTTFGWESSGEGSGEWWAEKHYPKETWQREATLTRRVAVAFGLLTSVPPDPQPSDSADSLAKQANRFGAAIQEFSLRYGTASPPEPKGTQPPRSGRFVARILAMDPVARTITIDRIQTFIGDPAYRAAVQDHAAEPTDDFYIRNRVKERTVLPLDSSVAFTSFQGLRPWQPTLGEGDLSAVTALDETEFAAQLADMQVQDVGAWIVVVDGRVVAVIGNYAV